MSDVTTDLVPFSAGYKLTEFNVVTSHEFDTIEMSTHRADDIRAWWTDAELPVVLRGDERHLVPKESPQVGYTYLRVPEQVWGSELDVAPFLVPDAAHTRLLTGMEDDEDV